MVTLIITSGHRHHRQVVLPAFAVLHLPPAFAVSPSAPSPPLQIVDCCVGRWSSPHLSREAGTAVIIKAAPSRPLVGCRCQGIAPLSSPPIALLGGLTSGLLLGGYEWPRLCRPYYKMLIVVLVTVPSFVEGGGDGHRH